jgi:hypothetical protein
MALDQEYVDWLEARIDALLAVINDPTTPPDTVRLAWAVMEALRAITGLKLAEAALKPVCPTCHDQGGGFAHPCDTCGRTLRALSTGEAHV